MHDSYSMYTYIHFHVNITELSHRYKDTFFISIHVSRPTYIGQQWIKISQCIFIEYITLYTLHYSIYIFNIILNIHI